MGWGPLILAFLSIATVLLKTWQDGAPNRTKEARNAEIQNGREDIANGNVAAVSIRIDSVQPVSTKATGNSSGFENDTDTARRIAAITEL